MAERLNAAVSKTVVRRKAHRGFESPPLRFTKPRIVCCDPVREAGFWRLWGPLGGGLVANWTPRDARIRPRQHRIAACPAARFSCVARRTGGCESPPSPLEKARSQCGSPVRGAGFLAFLGCFGGGFVANWTPGNSRIRQGQHGMRASSIPVLGMNSRRWLIGQPPQHLASLIMGNESGHPAVEVIGEGLGH